MNMDDNKTSEVSQVDVLFELISGLIEQARRYVNTSVNVAEVRTRFEVGRYIFESEQQGVRAEYGKQVLNNLSVRLVERFGSDWSYDTLKRCRFFYQAYANATIGATPLSQLGSDMNTSDKECDMNCGNTVAPIRLPRFSLSWSHYLVLMRIENIEARSFYEIECAQQQWSVRQLSRQVGSSLYERLALSRDKDEVMRLAREGQSQCQGGIPAGAVRLGGVEGGGVPGGLLSLDQGQVPLRRALPERRGCGPGNFAASAPSQGESFRLEHRFLAERRLFQRKICNSNRKKLPLHSQIRQIKN